MLKRHSAEAGKHLPRGWCQTGWYHLPPGEKPSGDFYCWLAGGECRPFKRLPLFVFIFFNHIYEESVPDRTMRVQSLFCTCFEFNTANQSGKSTYNFLMIWRTALRREQISLKIDITQVQYHRIKICPPNLQIHRDGSQLTGLMWLIKASVKSAPWEWKVAFLSAGSSRDSQHILLRSVGNFSCRLMSHITLIIETTVWKSRNAAALDTRG